MNIRILIFICIFSLYCLSAAGQTAIKDEGAIKSLVKQMTDAQRSYDAATLDKIFTSDYIEISPLGEFDPRDKVMGFYSREAKAAAGKMSVSLEMSDWNIRQFDDLFVVIVRLNYSMTNDGKEMPPRSLRATIVIKKEKGKLKIASSQFSGIRTATPPKPQE